MNLNEHIIKPKEPNSKTLSYGICECDNNITTYRRLPRFIGIRIAKTRHKDNNTYIKSSTSNE